MKKNLIISLLFLFAVSPAFGQDKQPEMMRGAKLSDLKPPAATLVIGANEIVGSIAEPGWPIIISAALMTEEGVTATPPANLKLKVSNEKGIEVPLAFAAVPQSAQSGEEPKFYWLAPESATQGLTPGRYNITFEPVEGFAIESGDLKVVPADKEHDAELGSLKIQRSLLLGQDDEALAEADKLTISDAENSNAWIAKGDILMGKDLPDEALVAYDKALEIEEKTDSEPLFILERRRAAFFRSLEKRGVMPNIEDTKP